MKIRRRRGILTYSEWQGLTFRALNTLSGEAILPKLLPFRTIFFFYGIRLGAQVNSRKSPKLSLLQLDLSNFVRNSWLDESGKHFWQSLLPWSVPISLKFFYVNSYLTSSCFVQLPWGQRLFVFVLFFCCFFFLFFLFFFCFVFFFAVFFFFFFFFFFLFVLFFIIIF